MDFKAEVADAIFFLSFIILPIDASKKSGSDSSLSVCPVGAVSKTMREKALYSFDSRNCMTFEIAIASSRPGGGVSNSSPSFSSPSCSASIPRPMLSIIFLTPLSPCSWLAARNSSLVLSGLISSAYNGESTP
uniref:Putative ovule protein n=1 Tax=Solanum chacoense TaxID=4108 RepID=A0A0V0GW51_SOLCH